MPPLSAFTIRQYRFAQFTWDPQKREINLHKHGFDFVRASDAFSSKVLVARSDRFGELRWLALAKLYADLVAIAYTVEEAVCHILSIRRARDYERETYVDRSRALQSKG